MSGSLEIGCCLLLTFVCVLIVVTDCQSNDACETISFKILHSVNVAQFANVRGY